MFQDKLQFLLKQNHISALALAKEIGVPKSLVYEWRSGVRAPSAKNLRKLSQYFGVGVGELLEEPGDMSDALTVLFRQARQLTPGQQQALVEALRANLPGYFDTREEEAERLPAVSPASDAQTSAILPSGLADGEEDP